VGVRSLILLDTHVAVWATVEPRRLSGAAVSALKRARVSDGMAISAISLWELASLFKRGRVATYASVAASIDRVLETLGAVVKPITPEIAVLAAHLPVDYPRDPADRLIGATAQAEALPLVTSDEKIRASTLLKTIW
jgi:PIN domain nuclease of toxin-antitoxin system